MSMKITELKDRVITRLRYAADNRTSYSAYDLAEEFGVDHLSIEAIVDDFNATAAVKVSLGEDKLGRW